jgi:hypothetical protein
MTLAELTERLAAMPPLERARAAHELLTGGGAQLARVRREAIAQEVARRGRGGVGQVAAELGISRQKVSDALTQHRRDTLGVT